jgi:hypothetical protein
MLLDLLRTFIASVHRGTLETMPTNETQSANAEGRHAP